MQEDPEVAEGVEISLSDILSKLSLSGYGSDFQLANTDAKVLNESQAKEIIAQSLLSIMQSLSDNQVFYQIKASVKAGKAFSINVSPEKINNSKMFLIPYFNGMALNAIKSEFTATVANDNGSGEPASARPGPIVNIISGFGNIPQANPLDNANLANLSRLHRPVQDFEHAEEAVNAAGFITANAVLSFYPRRFKGVTKGHHDHRKWVVELTFNKGIDVNIESKMRALTWFTAISNGTLKEDQGNPRKLLSQKAEIEKLCYVFGIHGIYADMGNKCEIYYAVESRKNPNHPNPSKRRDNPEKIFTVPLKDHVEAIKEQICRAPSIVEKVREAYGTTTGDAEDSLSMAFDSGFTGTLHVTEAATPQQPAVEDGTVA